MDASTHQRPALDRLTAADLFMLWDDYGWCADVGALAVVDGSSGLLDAYGALRIDAVRRHVERRLARVPRFRQVVVRPPLGFGWPLWVDAPGFSLSDHVRVRPLGREADEETLLAVCQELAQRPFHPDRPLWELWLLPGLPDGKVGVYVKLHHALGDGAAGVAAFGALLDLAPTAPDPEPRLWCPAPTPTRGHLLRDNIGRRRAELSRGLLALARPRQTLRVARQTLPAWREVLTEDPAPPTSLNEPVGPSRRLSVLRRDLEEVRQVAHAHGAKINDVVLTAVAGGLHDLLAGRGEDVTNLTLRAMVPISLHREHTGQAVGNQDSWMMIPLPVGEADPIRRLARIAGETAARRGTVRPATGTGMFRFRALQRLWYHHFPRQRSVNLVVTNVAGPPVPVYLCGARLLELAPVVALMGNLTLVVAVLSYDGQLAVTVVSDPENCGDADVFVDGMGRTLDVLASIGAMR